MAPITSASAVMDLPIVLSDQVIREVYDLYQRGLYVQALRCGERCAPIRDWSGTQARLLAGRIAYNVGAPRLGRAMHWLARRNDPCDAMAAYFHALSVFAFHGPLRAWEMQEKLGDLPEASDETRADFFALRARTFGTLRDFETAESWSIRAFELAPDRAWLYVEQTSLLSMQDRYEEALAAAHRALELRPMYRPAVEAVSETLQALGRDEEALTMLVEASEQLESASVLIQHAHLLSELDRNEEARSVLERAPTLLPLLESHYEEWLIARRSDLAYLCGDIEAAFELARQGKDAFFKGRRDALKLAREASAESRRVRLSVPFVRQHHNTCVPATLASLSRYWEKPVDHLEVAEAICYDGTPMHAARQWAEQQGYHVVEFTPDWDQTAALIDREIPFAIVLSGVTQSHLVAVIGYDTNRRTWLFRDPTSRHVREAVHLDSDASEQGFALRAMVLVPKEQADLLNGLTLRDTALWDHHYRIQSALMNHDRAGARLHYDRMVSEEPDHSITREARLSLAGYDGDQTTRLRCVEQLLIKAPEDPRLKIGKLFCLRDLGRRQDRLELLEECCSQPNAPPVFWQQYAQELAEDARFFSKARWLLRRAMRREPHEGSFLILARICWREGDVDMAMRLNRFATCLADRDEHLAQSYFNASQALNRVDEVLNLLRNRFERLGYKSGLPARTLVWAYDQLNRPSEAFALLDEAIARRPDDGDLLLFAANFHGYYGHHERMEELLTRAKATCNVNSWHRAWARLTRVRGDRQASLDQWRLILQDDPLAMDAHASVARLLAETEGLQAAMSYLEETAYRFPHSYPIHQLWIQWLQDDAPEKEREVLEHLMQINPADVWTHRQLALNLARGHQLKDALSQVEQARQLDPRDSYTLALMGRLSWQAGRLEQGRESFKESLRLSIDTTVALVDLVNMSRNAAERREALAFIHGEIVRQTIQGDCMLAYRDCAEGTLNPEELLTSVQEARQARPDLWQTWLAVVQQLTLMGRLDEALALARETVEEFPLVVVAWVRLADVHRGRNDADGEIEALEHALTIQSDDSALLRRLASVHQRREELDKAVDLLRRAVVRDPLNDANSAHLASLLWLTNQRKEAMAQVERAVELNPDNEWAWLSLLDWSQKEKQPERPLKLARELTTRLKGDTNSWLVLAKMLPGSEHDEERRAAIRQAIALNHRCQEAYELLAEEEVNQGHFEKAIEACRPEALKEDRPFALRMCEAWVLSMQGRLKEAVEQARDVIQEDPTYLRAWGSLVRWLTELEREQEALEAADQLIRLDARNPASYAARAKIHLTAGHRAGAKADFQEAFTLDPMYDYAAMNLFDLQLEDNELDPAAATLARLKEIDGGPFTIARDVMLAARKGDSKVAFHGLRALCMSEVESGWPINAALDALVKCFARDQIELLLLESLDQPGVNVHVGWEWSRRYAPNMKPAQCWKLLNKWRAAGPAGNVATVGYVGFIVEYGRRSEFLGFFRKHGRHLKDHTEIWENVSYGLHRFHQHARFMEWIIGWEQRADITSWGLLLVALCYHVMGKPEQARRAHELALRMPADHQTYRHQIWLALEEALAGQTESPLQRLNNLQELPADESYYRFLHDLVVAITTLLIAKEQCDPEGFRKTRRLIAEVAKSLHRFRKHPEIMRAYHRTLRCIASVQGGMVARLWAILRR